MLYYYTFLLVCMFEKPKVVAHSMQLLYTCNVQCEVYCPYNLGVHRFKKLREQKLIFKVALQVFCKVIVSFTTVSNIW